jgi:DNA invertase Pin-like site-specific DNA recombinase
VTPWSSPSWTGWPGRCRTLGRSRTSSWLGGSGSASAAPCTTRPTRVGRLLFNVLAMVVEADLIRLRTNEGMRVAKAEGRLRGKQPNLNPRQEAHLVALLRSGEYSTAEIGDLFGVARSTVYRAIGRDNARQRAQRSGAAPIQ